MSQKTKILFSWYSCVCLLIIGIAAVVVVFSRKNVATLSSFVAASEGMTSGELPMNNVAFELNRRFTETGQLLASAIDSGEASHLNGLTNQIREIEEIVSQSFDGAPLDAELSECLERFAAYVESGSAIALAYIEDPEQVEPSELAGLTSDIIDLKEDLRRFQLKQAQRLDDKLNDIGAESRRLSLEHGALVKGVALVALLAVIAALAAAGIAVRLVRMNARLSLREKETAQLNAELRGHESALRERTERLEEALGEVKKAQEKLVHHERMDALGRMASGIAHDFNNILTPIIGYADMLLATESYEDTRTVKDELETILAAALEGKSVVERLREFYRTDEDKECEPVRVAELLANVVTLTKPVWQVQAGGDGWSIDVNVDAEPALGVKVNRRRLHQVLTNLVINAVDAMPEGGRLTLAGRQCAEESVITITDTGEGMTPEVLAQCWEPFYTTKGEKGTGMGLSICRDIIESYKGRVTVDSRPGEGTEIALHLPAVSVTAGTAGPRTSSVSEAAAGSGATAAGKTEDLKILVVDDDTMITGLIDKTVRLLGHRVECANTAADALELLANGNYDLLITDKSMPGVGGDAVAAGAKRLERPIPVIMLTGFGDMGLLYGDLPEHVDLVISKPADTDSLRKGIARVMGA